MYNILICDDEPDIRSALKIYLSSEGYGIFEAENGSQALDIIAKEEISLLLMDVMMPVMDGITALSTLRKTSNIPVILLTAKSQDFDKVSGLNAGADDYITKPFVPVEVIARVRSQLRRYKRLGGATEPEEKDSKLCNGGIEYDDKSKTVTVDGEPVIPQGLERHAVRLGEHRHRPYPPPERKDRDKPRKTRLSQGLMGPRLQNGEEISGRRHRNGKKQVLFGL